MSRQGKRRPRTIENVKDFWNSEADDWGDDPRVTIRDHHFRLLTISRISELVKGRRYLLDIGCGSGFSTLFYAQVVDRLVGVDYAEVMVKKAQRFLQDPIYFDEVMSRYAADGAPVLSGNVKFEEGNVLDIAFPTASFDAIVSERVLINLPNRVLQSQAVREIARVLKPDGLCILLEVTSQGHKRVDQMRDQFGLPPLEKYWHNLYLDDGAFKRDLKNSGFALERVESFETYQFLSKVVHAACAHPAEPQFLSGFNLAARLFARKYPEYSDVVANGYERSFAETFRNLLEEYDPAMLAAYDRVLPSITANKPDFASCSHQLLYLLRRT